MPYTISNPPERIKKLPKAAQKIWITAFNANFSKGEETASKIAWAAIQRAGYRQSENGNWHRWE